MDRYSGSYVYHPMRKGLRYLVKKDGTFPPPDAKPGDLLLTCSIRNYRMVVIGDIRVLEILPGSFDDALHCQLRVVRIEDRVVYDALSYMWGDPSAKKKSIRLNGEEFPVTESLHNALRHVRLSNNVRCLWADAVSINQGDIKERGNQVNMMKEIYSRCQTVRVWIDVTLNLHEPCIRRLFALQMQTTVDQLGDDPSFWNGLLPLLQNPYWDRLWIQQELLFPPKLVFHCRGVTIPGNCLMAFQFQMFRKANHAGNPFSAEGAWSQFAQLASKNEAPSRALAWCRAMMKHKAPVDPHTLEPDLSLLLPEKSYELDPQKWGPWLSTTPIYILNMLRRSQSLNATDPRDRVIATLNLVIDYQDDGEEMDYEEDLTARYRGLARLLPFKCNSLQFLALTKVRTTPDPDIEDLPSWAPNWNPPGNAEYFLSSFRAAGDLPMYGTPFQGDLKDGIMHARGFHYADVNRTLSNINNASAQLSVLSSLFISTVKSSRCRISDIIALARTLTGPSSAQLRIEHDYFSKDEMILYTGILLCLSFVDPKLRITDLIPYITTSCNSLRKDLTIATRACQASRRRIHSCLRWLELDKFSAAVPKKYDQTERFGHFVNLISRTLSSGCLTSISSTCALAITEGNAQVSSGDEVWILFGCATPMILRHSGSHYLVVSPAYIFDIMEGETMDGVTTPDDKFGGWPEFFQTGPQTLTCASATPYWSGRIAKWVQVISLR